jgi:hypothetical protein
MRRSSLCSSLRCRGCGSGSTCSCTSRASTRARPPARPCSKCWACLPSSSARRSRNGSVPGWRGLPQGKGGCHTGRPGRAWPSRCPRDCRAVQGQSVNRPTHLRGNELTGGVRCPGRSSSARSARTCFSRPFAVATAPMLAHAGAVTETRPGPTDLWIRATPTRSVGIDLRGRHPRRISRSQPGRSYLHIVES